MRKRIGYAKLGRSIHINPKKFGFAGDPEAPNLLRRLALRNPEVDWVIIGKNDGHLEDMPANVIDPWPRDVKYERAHDTLVENMIADLDGAVIHLGQHGTSNTPITMSNIPWATHDADPAKHQTNPLEWALNYGGFLIRGLNRMGDRTDGHAPVVYICVDPRNFHKARDVKWPTGTEDILSQYEYDRVQRHERWRDSRLPAEFDFTNIKGTDREDEIWLVRHQYRYAGIEMMILPDDWDTWGTTPYHDRIPIGMTTTSYYVPENRNRRSWLTREYVLKAFPDAPVFGKWDEKSLADVAGWDVTFEQNSPADFHKILGSFRTTLSLPATSRNRQDIKWVVAKPWQGFAANTVTFMLHPSDAQGYILPSRKKEARTHQVADGLWSVRDEWTESDIHLARWLRVNTADELQTRVNRVNEDLATYEWLVTAQRDLLRRRWGEQLTEHTIESRLGL